MLNELADNKPTEDPGIGSSFERPLDRLLGADGKFRVQRLGAQSRLYESFGTLVTMRWGWFILLLLLGFVLVNLLFTGLFLGIGAEYIVNAQLDSFKGRFYSALFLSTQTLTTVGYGNYYPGSPLTWAVAMGEAMVGVICFGAIAAIFYARIARPVARMLFCQRALVAPYKEGWSLQVRVANLRSALLMDVEARVLLVLADVDDQGERINYYNLKLEIERIQFMPLSWNIVHAVTPDSPLAGLSMEDLREHRAELLVVVKGMDEAYSQMVHSRHSYLFSEIVWGGRFVRAFAPNPQGGVVLDLRKVHAYRSVPAPPHLPK
jgi:inward rectifier potassium channel